MSNDKVQAEIVKSLESEANYKKIVPNILKEVVASNRSYIFNLIQLSSAILSNPKYDSSTKYWSLLLIKDVMQLNQNLFATSLIESQIMATLEAICLKNPKTDKETELLFGPEANPKYSKRFYILMIECIKIWGQRYQDAKAPLGKYYTIYNGLIQKGVEFPTVYYFFQNKPEPQDASKPAGKGVPEQNVNKKPGESSTKPMGEFGKTAEMQKQQQQQQQQIAGNFSFKAQSPVAEDHKQEEEEYYDEDLPIMYNAGELEIDESEQTEYEEEGDSMEDFKVVQKKPEPEKPRPQLQIQTQSQPQPKQQLQPQPLVQPQTQPQSKQQSQQQSPLQPQPQPQLQSQQQSKPQPQPEPIKKEEKEKEPEKKKGGILQALGFGKKSSSEDLKKGDTPKKVDSKNEVKTPVDSGRKKETEPKANIVEQKPETLPAKNVVNRVIESPVEKKAVQNVEAGPVTKPQGVVYQQPKEVKNVNFIVQQEVINEGSPALNKSVDKGQGKVVVQQEVIKEGKQSPLNKSVEQVQGKVSRPGTPVEVKKNRSEEEKEKDKIPEKMGKIDINIQLDMKAIEKLGKADQVGNSGSAKTVEGILQKAAEPMSGKDVKPPLDPQVLQKKKSDSFVEWEEVVETNPNKQSSSRRNSRNSVSKDVREEQQGPSSSQFKPKAQDISNEKITLESFSEDKEVINYTLTQSGQSGKASKEPQRDQNLASIRKKSEGYYYNSKDSSSQNAPTDPRAQRRNSENVPNKDVPVKAGSVQGLAFGIYPKFANTQQGVVNNKVVVNESPTQVQESKNIQQLNKNIEKAPVNTPASSNKPERDQPSLQVEKKKSSDKGQANNTLVLPNSAASSAQKELDMSNVQKEEHNRGRGHSQGPSGSDFVRKRSASTRAEPDAPNKNVSDLQQKYDALSGENMKIKAQLEKMSRQLKEETQKSNMLQERLSTTQYDRREQVNTSYQEDRRSLSPSKKLTLKTEIPAGLSNTFNNTLNGTRTTYSSGFRSYEGSAQKPVRGRSPKVETIKDSTLTATYGSFLHKKYALFNDSYPLATEPGINTVDNFMNNPRRKNEFNPLMTTMLKTEFFQSTWGQEPLWKTQDYINRSAISHSDDLVFSTTFDKVRLSCLKNQEILFESQELKVESSTFYTRSVTGRLSIVLIFTNKAESTLTEFNVTYSRSTRGFMVTPEQSYFETKLTPGKSEFHTLNAELIGHPTEIGVMVVEFRLNDELHRFKMNFPLIITKFMRFIPVSVSDYVRGRKSLLLRYPSNIDESQPIQVSDEYMNILQESFLAKLINVPVEDDKVTMYVACFSLGGYSSEYYLRIIVEKEKQSVIIQIVYPGEGMQDAKNLLNKLVFLFDEKSTL